MENNGLVKFCNSKTLEVRALLKNCLASIMFYAKSLIKKDEQIIKCDNAEIVFMSQKEAKNIARKSNLALFTKLQGHLTEYEIRIGHEAELRENRTPETLSKIDSHLKGCIQCQDSYRPKNILNKAGN